MPPLALIFGILGASLALVIELVVLNLGGSLSYSPLLPNFSNLSTLVLVAVIEEAARYLLLRQYIVRFLANTEPLWRQTLLIGILFGSGFASIELALLFGQGATPLVPAFGIALVHIALSLLFASSLTKKLPFPALSIFVSGVLIHLAYNTVLTLFP